MKTALLAIILSCSFAQTSSEPVRQIRLDGGDVTARDHFVSSYMNGSWENTLSDRREIDNAIAAWNYYNETYRNVK